MGSYERSGVMTARFASVRAVRQASGNVRGPGVGAGGRRRGDPRPIRQPRGISRRRQIHWHPQTA
jgi:hypothetical protein